MAVVLVRLLPLVGACGWPERAVGEAVVLPADVALLAAAAVVECETAAAGSVAAAAETPRVSKLTMPRCAADVMAAAASRWSGV